MQLIELEGVSDIIRTRGNVATEFLGHLVDFRLDQLDKTVGHTSSSWSPVTNKHTETFIRWPAERYAEVEEMRSMSRGDALLSLIEETVSKHDDAIQAPLSKKDREVLDSLAQMFEETGTATEKAYVAPALRQYAQVIGQIYFHHNEGHRYDHADSNDHDRDATSLNHGARDALMEEKARLHDIIRQNLGEARGIGHSIVEIFERELSNYTGKAVALESLGDPAAEKKIGEAALKCQSRDPVALEWAVAEAICRNHSDYGMMEALYRDDVLSDTPGTIGKLLLEKIPELRIDPQGQITNPKDLSATKSKEHGVS